MLLSQTQQREAETELRKVAIARPICLTKQFSPSPTRERDRKIMFSRNGFSSLHHPLAAALFFFLDPSHFFPIFHQNGASKQEEGEEEEIDNEKRKWWPSSSSSFSCQWRAEAVPYSSFLLFALLAYNTLSGTKRRGRRRRESGPSSSSSSFRVISFPIPPSTIIVY